MSMCLFRGLAQSWGSTFFTSFFLCQKSVLDLQLDLKTPSKAPFPQEILLFVDHVPLNLQIVFLFIDITVRRVVILVLKVLEPLFSVQRGKKFSISDFHLD